MANPDITIRGVRQSIPPGYVLGRSSPGAGPAELLPIKVLAQGVANSGVVQTPLVSGTGITISGNVISASGGGGSNPFFPPPASIPAIANFTLTAATTWPSLPTMVNMPSGRGIFLSLPPTTSNPVALLTLNGYTPPAAGTNFSVSSTSMVAYAAGNTNLAFGIFLQDNTGKFVTWGPRSGASTYLREQWTNINTFSAFNNEGAAQSPPESPRTMKIQRVGTNLVYSISFDGENFLTVLTESATSFLGATLASAGVVWISNGGSVAYGLSIFAVSTSSP